LVLDSDGGPASLANFINARQFDPPTGIITNNLPYIGLILLAIAALALFILAKKRRKKTASYY
jgi:LPXTG-motif cell wall-anchored protein